MLVCLQKGFPVERSEQALIQTHNVGVEAAVNWLTAHEHEGEFGVPLTTVYFSEGGFSAHCSEIILTTRNHRLRLVLFSVSMLSFIMVSS